MYDVTNAPSATANTLVSAFNRLAKDTLGLGGVFHGGVEVFGREWSFGMCEGPGVTGVYACEPAANPMYQYREAVTLGEKKKRKRSMGIRKKRNRKNQNRKKYKLKRGKQRKAKQKDDKI